MKTLRVIIITACLIFACFGCWKIYSILSGYSAGKQTYEELESFISVPDTDEPQAAEESVPEPREEPETPSPEVSEDDTADMQEEAENDGKAEFPSVDFEALRSINPGVVGWIYCEGTTINYPVVQGTDNDYYLTHMFDGRPNSSGAIFLNNRNNPDFSDRNSIIFGHHMKNGSMFTGITKYKQQDYYEEHPVFLLITPEANYVMEVFAGIVVAEWDPFWKTGFADDAEMEQWLSNILSKSLIATDVVPSPEDTILSLSTCTYEYDGARFVVLGILKAA